jgi:hypothetical protein
MKYKTSSLPAYSRKKRICRVYLQCQFTTSIFSGLM